MKPSVRFLSVSLLALTALASTGCHKHQFTVGSGGNVEGEAAYDKWESHWFFGMIGTTEVNLKEVCPSGNATIKDGRSFLNGLVGSLVGIIWSPTTVTIYCDSGSASADAPDGERVSEVTITLSPAEMQRIAQNPQTLKWAERVSLEGASELRSALSLEPGAGASERAVAQQPGQISF